MSETRGPEDHEDNSIDHAFADAVRSALIETTVTATIIGASSPSSLLDEIVQTAARAIPSPEGALFLIDHDRQVLTFDVVIGSTAASVRDITVPLGHGIAGLVASSGQALAISNAQDDPRHARDVAEQSGYLPTTILAVPVVDNDGRPIGVLELLDRQGQPTYSLADMELLGMFAAQVSTVLRLRHNQDVLGAALADALTSLGDIPPHLRENLEKRSDAFARQLASTSRFQETQQLTDLVMAVALRGPAEQALCADILGALRQYLDSKPSMGQGFFR